MLHLVWQIISTKADLVEKGSRLYPILSLFLVRTKGFALLAARPNKRLLIVWFAVIVFLLSEYSRQTNRSRDFFPPQIPSSFVIYNKKRWGKKLIFFLLVRTKGFEPTRCYPQEPETCASASFATSAFIRNDYYCSISLFNCQLVFRVILKK